MSNKAENQGLPQKVPNNAGFLAYKCKNYKVSFPLIQFIIQVFTKLHLFAKLISIHTAFLNHTVQIIIIQTNSSCSRMVQCQMAFSSFVFQKRLNYCYLFGITKLGQKLSSGGFMLNYIIHTLIKIIFLHNIRTFESLCKTLQLVI